MAFDDEDVSTPESAGMDDVSMRLADIMTQIGVLGCYNLTGEKTRSLERRGRKDVIRAIARHVVASHSNVGSHHPMVAEYVENKDWHTAVAIHKAEEEQVVEDMLRVFGRKPPLYHCHALLAIPITVHVAGLLGMLHSNGPILWTRFPDEVRAPSEDYAATAKRWCGFSWWCNTLCTSGSHRCGEPVWEANETENILKNIRQRISSIPSVNFPVFQWIHAGHPMMYRAKYYLKPKLRFFGTDTYACINGWNLPTGQFGKLGKPDLRTPREMAQVYRNFKAVFSLYKDSGFRFISPAEIAAHYTCQPANIDFKRLLFNADLVAERLEFITDDIFSPAEFLLGFAQVIIAYDKTGKTPKKVKRIGVLGPVTHPVSGVEVPELSWDELLRTAAWILVFSTHEGHLPANINFNGRRVGIGTIYEAFTRVIRNLARGKKTAKIKLDIVFRQYPTIGVTMAREILGPEGGRLSWPGASVDNIYTWTKLQAWTIKRAIYRPA